MTPLIHEYDAEQSTWSFHFSLRLLTACMHSSITLQQFLIIFRLDLCQFSEFNWSAAKGMTK